MRMLVVATATAGTILSLAPAAHAHAPLTNAPACHYAAFTDPQVEGSYTGWVGGGGILIGDQYGYLTCTIQVNAATHAGADACTVTGPTTYAVVWAGGLCTYAASPGDNVYVCTQVDIVSPVTETWYLDSGSGTWSQNPNVPCAP